MSCDVAAAAFLFLASSSPSHALPVLRIDAPAAGAQSALSREPLFADIVQRAAKLKADTEVYRKGTAKAASAPLALPRFDDFQSRIAALSDLDMKGHVELAKRGTDGDLKCILRGISQDLPKKLDELMKAGDAATQATALRDMYYLLNDNVEVITAPPQPEV